MPQPLECLSQARLVELTQTLLFIPSVTGQEHALADWVAYHFQAIGLSRVQRLPVEGAADTAVFLP